MLYWFSNVCIVWAVHIDISMAVHAGSLHANTTISVVRSHLLKLSQPLLIFTPKVQGSVFRSSKSKPAFFRTVGFQRVPVI